ncbi:MAG: hypothetical protein U0228_01485 [Myxococcaceae bacterium]
MIGLALALGLAAAPPVVLVERDVTAPRSTFDAVLIALRERLEKKGLRTLDGVKRCGQPDCLARVARDESGVAIGVALGKGRKGVVVDLEAVGPAGDSLTSTTFTLLPDALAELPDAAGLVDEVSRAVATLAAREAPKPVADAPKIEVTREPEPVADEPEDEVPPGFWARPPARITLLSTCGVAVIAIATGVIGAAMKGALDADVHQQPPVLTRPEALDRASSANAMFTVSLISSLVSVVGAGVLLILFAGDAT